jgi:hypothetical protein
MMAENRLTMTSKLKRTIAWLILSSLWLVAACAPGEVYGPPPSSAYALPPSNPGYNYPSYYYPDYYLSCIHSDCNPGFP